MKHNMIDLNPKQKLLLQWWYLIMIYDSGGEIPTGELKETIFLTCRELVRLNFPMK